MYKKWFAGLSALMGMALLFSVAVVDAESGSSKDTDKDGIIDTEDTMPEDHDNDGLNDDEDNDDDGDGRIDCFERGGLRLDYYNDGIRD